MNFYQLIQSLPDHWRVYTTQEEDAHPLAFCDDGRDYDKPMFLRKDGLARIYFNKAESETSGYLFAIAYDWHSDGDCCGDLSTAIQTADRYVAEDMMTWNEETNQYE